MILLFFISLIISFCASEALTPPPTHHYIPNCYLSTGCANAAVCKCTLYVTDCDINTEPEGKCVLTSFGLVVVIGLCVLACILLIILASCMWCCCLKRCCKDSKLPQNVYHYHGPITTAPLPIHDML